ncbi:hypothetical protein O6H91_02G070300 [Diphasiastrum complanatum]|uniref:Uncharacterized protein n=1 Tax=Diphasiastrum complanatum TaxID=34168 RepID=A0ACC2EGU7_DIPCM|nr:hypothetical protein O6H91_02G070300 [Diphasiastrum complanatum]
MAMAVPQKRARFPVLVALPVLAALMCLYCLEVAADDVVALTPDTFEQEVGKERAALVEFYAPWCGHCKKLAPEYEKVGSTFKKSKPVLIAKVDCDDHKSLCSKYGVSGFPTIKWFPKGSLKPKDYSGARTAEALLEYVNSEAGTRAKSHVAPSDVIVLTPTNFDEIALDKTKHVLVEFYAPWCGHCKNLAPVYEQLATTYKAEKDVIIAKLDADAHKDLAQRYDIGGYPTLKFFLKSNKDGVQYEGGHALDDFVAFINEKAGTHRNSDGGLTADAGIITSLSTVVEEFFAAKAEERHIILAKVEEQVSELEGSSLGYGRMYVKVLKSVIDKGEEYPRKEYDRLQRILSGAVHPSKLDEFTIKRNVLSSFVKQQ